MDFLNLISRAPFLLNDPTLSTLRAFLPLHKSMNAVYEKYIKCKKSSRQHLFSIFSVPFI